MISFTVGTDGRLPTGATLREAIETVDSETDATPAYYMINCAHPRHFEHVLEPGERWTTRIGALRANSSAKSHAELNESPTLDEGNPAELGNQYSALVKKFAWSARSDGMAWMSRNTAISRIAMTMVDPAAAAPRTSENKVLNISLSSTMNDVHDRAIYVNDVQVKFERRSQNFMSGP